MAKMQLTGNIDGLEHAIEVDDLGEDDGHYTVTVDGKLYHVDARTLQSGVVSALIENHSYDIDIERLDKGTDTLDGRLAVRVRGRVLFLEMLDNRRLKMKQAQATRFSEDGVAKITSPMPGKVMRVLVNEEDVVSEGQGVIVIEAMKMENELRAPKSGVVKSIHVKAGDSVDGGVLLINIE